MKVQIVLEPLPTHTQYVPLAVLGYCLTRAGFLQPVWDEIDWAMKTIRHVPTEKLQDMLVSILAGNKTVYQINTRLRPDLTLATAWHRESAPTRPGKAPWPEWSAQWCSACYLLHHDCLPQPTHSMSRVLSTGRR